MCLHPTLADPIVSTCSVLGTGLEAVPIWRPEEFVHKVIGESDQ